MADRVEQAERELQTGDANSALRLLRAERLAPGVQRDAGRLREIVELARRIQEESEPSLAGEAGLLVRAAESDLRFAEREEAIGRTRLEEARAAVEAGEAGKASSALRDALQRQFAKPPERRDFDTLTEIVALSERIAPNADWRARRRLESVTASARYALAGLEQGAQAPPQAARPTTGTAAGSGGDVGARLDAFERQLQALEASLLDLREQLPALRALSAGASPSAAAHPAPPTPVEQAWPPALQVPPARAPARPPAAPRAAPAPAPAAPRVPRITAADLQDARVLAWAGGIVTLLGIVFISVLAADRGWVSAELRVILGALISVALYGAGLVAYRRYDRTWAALAAAGTGIAGAYVTIAAAAAVYDFLGKPAALLAAAFVAAVGVATAVAWDTQTTAVLGLVGAMAGTAVLEGGFTVVGTGLAAVVFAATVVLTVWKRWLETMVIGGLTGVALTAGLLGSQDVGDDTGSAVVAGAFAALFVAGAIGHEVRPARPRFGAELVPAAGEAFLLVGVVIMLSVSSQVDGGSPAGVVVILAGLWLGMLVAAVVYQVVLGGARLRHIPITLLVAGFVLALSTTRRYFGGSEEGLAFLGAALVYLAPLPLLRGRAQRDLASALWATALTLSAVGVTDLLSGSELALVWAAEGALLSWLALRMKELRLLAGAVAYLALALGQTLAFEAPLRELFVANDDPAQGVPALVYVAAGLLVFAAAYRRRGPGRVRLFGEDLPVPTSRSGSFAAAGLAAGVTLYAASLSILGLSVWLADDGYEVAFERGHPIVSALWALIALALVSLGLRRPSTPLHFAGLGLFVFAIVELLAYDVAQLSDRNAAFAALAVGVPILAAGFDQGRLSDARSGDFRADPFAIALVGASLALVVPAIVVLLPGTVWGLERDGAGLLAAGAVYGALGALVFRERRDLSTVLWAPALALAAAAAAVLFADVWLALAWSAVAVALAWLARRAAEPRFMLSSGAFVALAVGFALAWEVTPENLFVAEPAPAAGLPSLVLATIAAYVFAAYLAPGALREGAFWAAGALTVYAASVAILGVSQWAAADDSGSVDDAFVRGQTAMSSFWAIVGLVLLAVGLRRNWRDFRIGGLVLFAIAVVKIFLYDLSALSAMARALSFLAVGLVLLFAAFLYQRLSAHEDTSRAA